MKCRFVSLILPLVAVVLSAPRLDAQATGTIHGTAFDASGAVVPDVVVTATNVNTNLARRVTSDSVGQYVIPLLPVGDYSVRVERPGFASFLQTGIRLQVNTDVEVNARLELRATAEQVMVNANTTLVQTTTSALVQVVDERRIADLPLNGRNVLQLMALNAGIADRGAQGGTIQVNTFGNGQFHVPVSINGSRGNATNFLLDNADNNDGFTNIAEPYPNPDAVQEFSIQSSSFDAQYGRGVGGVVNIVTRSGTNQIHGTAFDYLRNNKLNAGNFFSGKDALKRNQYGATFGGPVILPKLYNGKDRTFIFAAYQGTRQRVATPGLLRTAPSEAMKQGDLSAWLRPDGTGAIHDPSAPTQYFPGNRIPASRFDPVSAKVLGYIPSTADPTFQLRFGTPTRKIDDDQMTLRLDHSFSDRQRVSARYFLTSFDRPWVFIPTNLLFVENGQYGHAHSITVNHTYGLARFLNDLSYTFHGSTPTSAPPADLNVSFEALGARVKTVPGFPTMDLGISNWSAIGLGLGYYNGQRTHQVTENVSYASGRHNLRFGVDYRNHLLDKSSFFLTGGNAQFTGQLLSDPGKVNAGNSFGEFLLGRLGSWRQQSFWSEFLYTNIFALYVQDDFRVNQKLTLNLGLRWDPKFDSYESSGKRATFEAGRQSTRFPGAPAGMMFAADPGYEGSIVPNDWNNMAPRAGFAWQVRPRTVIRGAYGIFYDQLMGISNNRGASAEPFIRQSLLNAQGTLANPYGTAAPLDPSAVTASKDFVFSQFGTWAIPSKLMVTGYMQNWNFVIERQLRDVVLRAGYVGSKGVHLLHSPEVNPAIYGPGATAANYNQRRRYQPIAGIQLGRSDAWSKYHSLQLTMQKRYSRGFTVLANYTWSKSVDPTSYGSIEGSTSGPNPFNFNDNRGLSDFDIRHRLVVSGIWELPKLKQWNALARTILGDWQSNYIFSAQTGTPFTVISGVDNALMNTGNNFADLTGTDWRLPDGRSRNDQIVQYFSTAAFRVNAVGTIGTGRRNQLTSPGFWNADYSLFKTFNLAERFRFQLRGEFFNLFNHTRLGTPNNTVTSPQFGRITTAADPRIVQVAAKLIF